MYSGSALFMKLFSKDKKQEASENTRRISEATEDIGGNADSLYEQRRDADCLPKDMLL